MSFKTTFMKNKTKAILSNRKLSQIILSFCLVLLAVGVLTNFFSSPWQWFVTPLVHFKRVFPDTTFLRMSDSRTRQKIKSQCLNVLDNMVKGEWIQKSYSKEETDKVQRFLHISRETHFLPYNLQRPDNRCGNVTFDGLTKDRAPSLLWFRALCDPDGDLPCCHNNKCQKKYVTECACPDCYDLRQSVHAEMAEWSPSDKHCKMTYFESEEDICELIKGMTIYFIGDSFIRHLYTALLQILRKHKLYGPMMEYTTLGMLMACNEQTVYLGMCMNVLDKQTRECGNTVNLKFMEYPLVKQTNLTLEAIDELRNVTNALLVIGIGIHDNFDAQKVINKLIIPMMDKMSTFPEPKPQVLWSSMHAPGLLKTPRVPSQSKTSMALYNQRIRQILKTYSIPEFNTFHMTEDALSYDGAHYGKGVNSVKSQILLNYILDVRSNPSLNNKTRLNFNVTAT